MLKPQAACNMNRDEAGRPKEMYLGGKRRLRLSSQSQNSSVRKGDSMASFHNDAIKTIELVCEPLIRTRYPAELFFEEMRKIKAISLDD